MIFVPAFLSRVVLSQMRYPDSGTNLLPGSFPGQGQVLQRYYEVMLNVWSLKVEKTLLL